MQKVLSLILGIRVTKKINLVFFSANRAISERAQRFFKTGAGEYAEGDRFLSIRVPQLHKIAKKITSSLLKKMDDEVQSRIYKLYIANTEYINDWDIVDSSAEHTVGAWLMNIDRSAYPQVSFFIITLGDVW